MVAGYKLVTYRSSEGARAGLVIEDKVFDAAKLTGKAAYATVLGILKDWRAAQGVLKKAAGNAGKSRIKGLPLGRTKLLAAIMFPIGAEVGFSSAGAGALGTVALLSLTSLTATQVVGTDLAFGLVIAVVGTGVHLIAGHYNALLLAKLVAGGVVGGLVGSGAAPKIPNRSLRFALSLWLLFIGLQFCYQAAIK